MTEILLQTAETTGNCLEPYRALLDAAEKAARASCRKFEEIFHQEDTLEVIEFMARTGKLHEARQELRMIIDFRKEGAGRAYDDLDECLQMIGHAFWRLNRAEREALERRRA